MADWVEIAVSAGNQLAVAVREDIAALVSQRVGEAAAGVEIRDHEIVFWVDPKHGEAALATTKSVLRSFDDSGLVDANTLTAQIRPAVPEEEWRDAWKRYFKVIRLTRQLVVVPSWETYSPEPGDLLLHLDPGQAFGTGAHASTRLVLTELQSLADSDESAAYGAAVTGPVLDMGTGSGILLIAAHRLFPGARLVGIDVDDLSVRTAQENCDKNEVNAELSTTDISQIHSSFGLVLANIQADVLCAHAQVLASKVGVGGTLILSGLLAGQLDYVANTFVEQGLTLVVKRRSEHDPEWGVLRLTRSQ